MSEVSRDLERWLPVVGYEGLYEVSDQGRVRSVNRVITRKKHSPARLCSVVLKQTAETRGQRRLTVKLSKGGITRTRLVHHLVIESFTGPRPDGLLACHGDGNVNNNQASNLRWDTASSNSHDKRRHGTDHNLNKTRCPRSHLLLRPNLVACREKRGHRVCLACARARSRQHRAEARGEPFDFVADAGRTYLEIMSSDADPAAQLRADLALLEVIIRKHRDRGDGTCGRCGGPYPCKAKKVALQVCRELEIGDA